MLGTELNMFTKKAWEAIVIHGIAQNATSTFAIQTDVELAKAVVSATSFTHVQIRIDGSCGNLWQVSQRKLQRLQMSQLSAVIIARDPFAAFQQPQGRLQSMFL
jgi:hypothetical protein